MCSTVSLAHIQPTLQKAGPLPRRLFYSLSLLPFLSPSCQPTPTSRFTFQLVLVLSHAALLPPSFHFLSPSLTFFAPSLHRSAPRSYASSITTSTFLISVQPHPPGASSALLLNTWKPSETALLIPSLVSLPSLLSLFLPFHFPLS